MDRKGFYPLFHRGGRGSHHSTSTPSNSRTNYSNVGKVSVKSEPQKFESSTDDKFDWEFDKKAQKRKRMEIRNEDFNAFPMCGITVRLPLGLQPYPTQKLMMVRILTALKNKLNVLAESPTGSGKTMALLASVCAWLTNYYKERKEVRTQCPVHGEKKIEDISKAEDVKVKSEESFIKSEEGNLLEKSILEQEWDEDFTVANSLKSNYGNPEDQIEEGEEDQKIKDKCICLPRIRVYYGTRTHKQISQVVNEFARLPYTGQIRHTILASREQSCINEEARRSNDISQFCKDLNAPENKGCKHKTAMKQRFENASMLRSHIERNGDSTFDMESLVETLKFATPALCPYFCSTRVLTQDADLIFCPFTYLLDPLIRNSSDVHLKNSVVILDEAHNIEDTCRGSASFTFTEKEIDDCLHSLRTKKNEIKTYMEGETSRMLFEAERDKIRERLEKCEEIFCNLDALERWVLEISRWFRSFGEMTKSRPEGRDGKRSITFSWAMLFESLTNVEKGIDLFTPVASPRHQIIFTAYLAVCARNEGDSQWADRFRPSATSIVCMEKWFYFQQFFGREDYRPTYRLNVCIEPIKQFGSEGNRGAQSSRRSGAGPRNNKYADDDSEASNPWLEESEVWMDSRLGNVEQTPLVSGCRTSISLWCMSPAISFRDAFNDVRTVILASGTLCPMDTLKTELGVEFKAQMEGDQVIPQDRIFAAVVSAGPHGNRLQATYRNTSDACNPFYTEVGMVIRHVCMTVPAGVLCFLPSYRMLDQLKQLMEKNSWLRQIELKKMILFEPRRSSDLGAVMSTFEDAIQQPRKFGVRIDGALMFAVFRGKISEGIDFADDRARVVISVGIPFPNSVDELVSAKRKYNDENCKILGILNGEEWYVTQAYRALNQALGRCLRHKNDWGALILLDERLEKQASKAPMSGAVSARISKWIRAQLRVYPQFEQFNADFVSFFDRMIPKTTTAEVYRDPVDVI